MKHASYIGKDERLRGKTALVVDDPESETREVLAQFDDRSLGEAPEIDWSKPE